MNRGFKIVTFETWMQGCVNILDYLNSVEKTKTAIDKKIINGKEEYGFIKIPQRATRNAAGYDIYSPFSFVLKPGDDVTLPTGIKVYMQADEFFSIVPRSGLGFKYYTRLANTIGIIDSDYYNNAGNEGHCYIKIRNESQWASLEIKQGDAIAQGIFQKFLLADNDISENTRAGGFGSTG